MSMKMKLTNMRMMKTNIRVQKWKKRTQCLKSDYLSNADNDEGDLDESTEMETSSSDSE